MNKSLHDKIMFSIQNAIKKSLNEMAISREQLAEYDSIEIFNDTYIKVYKNGLYNLIDNDGNYLSTSWFTDIKQNNGGGVDVTIKDKNGKESKRSYTDYHDIKKSDELTSLVKHTDFLNFIDMKDIIMVTPYTLARPSMKRGVKIIAQVKYMGNQLLLGNDGILYNNDGTKYKHIKFSISAQDLHRFSIIADKLCKKLNSEYNPTIAKDEVFPDMKYKTSCFIFGFNTDNMVYNTSRLDFIKKSSIKNWTGNNIAVRFFVKNVENINKDYFIDLLMDLGFDENIKKIFSDYQAYTKTYKPTEINKLYDDLNDLLNI